MALYAQEVLLSRMLKLCGPLCTTMVLSLKYVHFIPPKYLKGAAETIINYPPP